jgi:transcriptional regulator with XRE-family HTH domain
VYNESQSHLGKIIRQQRVSLSLTLQDLAAKSGVSASHLRRIERGERFPSGHVLQRIAKHLSFGENELFTLAGYLSPQQVVSAEKSITYGEGHLDPFVARMLSIEPLEVQRAVIGILTILKSVARDTIRKEQTSQSDTENRNR